MNQIKRFFIYVAIICMLAFVEVQARVTEASINISIAGTGTPERLTSSQTLFTAKVTIQARSTNAAVVYVGIYGTMTTADTANYELQPGEGVTLRASNKRDEQNEEYQLYEWAVLGTANDDVHVSYEVRR